MAAQLRNMNFGLKKLYHPIFLYPPVVNPEVIRLNVALVEWNQKKGQIKDYENDDMEGNQGSDSLDSNRNDGDNEEFHDAVEY